MGAVVTGLDVTFVDDATWTLLDAAFVEHHVLVFRDQQLSEADHLAFASRWGPLLRHPYVGMAEHPDLILLENLGKARDHNQHWHSDMTYEATPPKLTMLYARAVPKVGGDTAFANQELAYRGLSDGLQATLDRLQAVHTAEEVAKAHGRDATDAPRATHPVVRTHDQSGRRSLYVTEMFTKQFVGWTPEESAPLLRYLFGHAVRPEYQMRHAWQERDLVMWDNRCLLHFAIHDHGDDPRVMHRCQVVGAAPV